MNAIESWVLGYVINAVWQTALLCAAAWVLARAMRWLGPRAEHRVWCVALVAEVLLPAVLVRPISLLWGAREAARGLVTVVTGEGVATGSMRMPSSLLGIAAAVYAALVGALALRLAWSLWCTRELGRQSQPLVLEGKAADVWQRACELFDVRDAEARVSDAVNGPVTIGVWRRLVIFPNGFVARVGRAELGTAIVHECAHMQRHDFAKNLLYEVLRLPVAWHPAVWLTKAKIAESREVVCDDLACAALTSGAMTFDAMTGRKAYARALLQLASTMVERTPQPNLHTIGVFDANRLEERVMRLTEKRFEIQGARRLVMAALCMAAGLGTLALAAELRVNVAVPVTATHAAPVGAQTGAVDGAAAARVSGGVMAGNLLSKTQPVYPQEAKDAGVSGAVVLHAIIAKDGTIAQLVVISGPEKLQASALDAVKQWVYKPYLLNGEPTEVETMIEVNYSLAK